MVARMDVEAEAEHDDEEPSDAEVQAYIDVGEEEGILEPGESKLLQSIVDFSDRLAREIMTPRIDVLAFDANRPLPELARLFNESKYSRIPIYRESIDQITGTVHIKDIFDAILTQSGKSVSDIARPPYVVSESKSVSELLREFQSEHIQVAVVVDEYGGTAGIVTIEDVVEEIVGEIADEHEEEEPTIVELGDRAVLVSGQMRVELLDEKLNAELTSDDYETVAGLIFTTLGRVPSAGTTVKRNGWRFLVDRADRRRIYRVKVSPDPEWKPADDREE
jgi:CBS domain containing-hemolysin-like protein